MEARRRETALRAEFDPQQYKRTPEMTRTRADSLDSSEALDSEPHHADADALARLERLLEAQLAPDSSAVYTPPEDTGAPPAKKKKLDNEATATETRPDEAAQPGQSAEVGQSCPVSSMSVRY